MITSEKEPFIKNNPFVKRSELALDRLVNRLQGSKAIGDLRGMPAQDLVVTAVNETKEPALTLSTRPELLGVGFPHPVRMIGANRAVVTPGRAVPAGSHRSQKTMSLHQPQIALSASCRYVRTSWTEFMRSLQSVEPNDNVK